MRIAATANVEKLSIDIDRCNSQFSSPIIVLSYRVIAKTPLESFYISQFAASMNFQAQRPPLSQQDEQSIRELKHILDGTFQLASKEDTKNLAIVLSYLNSAIIQRFKTMKIQAPHQDENLTASTYERCLQIKKKNIELTSSVLDLRAVLRKMISGGCQPSAKEDQYKKVVAEIRTRSEEVRAKLQKYRGTATTRPKLLSSEDLRGRGVEELKLGAEWLQRRTIELRRQVQTLRSYCLNQFSARD